MPSADHHNTTNTKQRTCMHIPADVRNQYHCSFLWLFGGRQVTFSDSSTLYCDICFGTSSKLRVGSFFVASFCNQKVRRNCHYLLIYLVVLEQERANESFDLWVRLLFAFLSTTNTQRKRLHTISFKAEHRAGKLWKSIIFFSILWFDPTGNRIQIYCFSSIDPQFIRPLTGNFKILTLVVLKLWWNRYKLW